jgi:hypothetical protein
MVVTNLNQFNRKVSKFAERIPREKVPLFIKKISLEALRRVVQKTPVDTGRARGGWQVTFNQPSKSPTGNTDPSGSGTISAGASKINQLNKPAAVFITNNVEYIIYLEDGTSDQAPKGMVAITIQELMGMFR